MKGHNYEAKNWNYDIKDEIITWKVITMRGKV